MTDGNGTLAWRVATTETNITKLETNVAKLQDSTVLKTDFERLEGRVDRMTTALYTAAVSFAIGSAGIVVAVFGLVK